MRQALLLLVVVAACGDGTYEIAESSDLVGRWTHASGGQNSAKHITFEHDTQANAFTFTVTLADSTFTSGTFEVNNGLVLLYPTTPADTTWCSPGAGYDGKQICYDAFGSACNAAPGRAGVMSPISGCYTHD